MNSKRCTVLMMVRSLFIAQTAVSRLPTYLGIIQRKRPSMKRLGLRHIFLLFVINNCFLCFHKTFESAEVCEIFLFLELDALRVHSVTAVRIIIFVFRRTRFNLNRKYTLTNLKTIQNKTNA